MKKLVLIALLIQLSALVLNAQSLGMSSSLWNVPRTGGELITEPSPEATAMRRYQDFPVSYASGTVDISIPLLSLPAGDASVSLGLSYHTGGIKRNDIPTEVGLGWSLTGLGIISRQVVGTPDEWLGADNTTDSHDNGRYNSH
ncbi:MAG: hypothetical protein K2G21_01875 [Muribaculaceae bacterium]|nr:hypothetical protein [Muribaculaceae bacterium]